MRIDLSPQSHVEHYRRWLDQTSAGILIKQLIAEVPFEQRNIRLFGKLVPQPRLVGWCGTLPYTYSGLTLQPREVPDCLQEPLIRVSGMARTPFNHLLLNLYRTGIDGMSYHSDDERELGPEPVVATLSLGATRRFSIKPRRGGKSHTLEIADGDLLIMAGRCQTEFVHAVPKQPTVIEPRISITFRRVLQDTQAFKT
jgi:alkylated DNA repair dioxygenase AlkB